MAVGDHLFSVLHSRFNRRHGSESRSRGNRPHLDSAVGFQNVDEVPSLPGLNWAAGTAITFDRCSNCMDTSTNLARPKTMVGIGKRGFQAYGAGSLIDRVVDEAKLPQAGASAGTVTRTEGPELPVKRLRIELKLASGTEKATKSGWIWWIVTKSTSFAFTRFPAFRRI